MNRKTERFFSELYQVECPDSTFWSDDPSIVFDKALGSTIWDIEGNSYIDCCAGFGALSLGHASKASQVVISQYLGDVHERPNVMHAMGDIYPSKYKLSLLNKIREFLPDSLAVGALTISGSQSVEYAIKSAMLAKGASGFIAFNGAYHGLDLGVLPVVSRSDFREPFKRWLSQDIVMRLDFGCCEDDLVDAINRMKGSSVGCAAVILEPIQGRAGVRIPQDGWLEMVRRVTHDLDVLLIFDEVFTGMGRCGQMSFAHHYDCDLICLGKALGGGLPISACFGRAEVMRKWPRNRSEAIHTGTFFGHPLCCQMAYETLCEIQRENLGERTRTMGAEIVQKLKSLLKDDKKVKEVRGMGFMIAVEFHKPGFGVSVMNGLREKGVIALPSGEKGEAISLTPAFNIESDLLLKAVDQLVEVIRKTN